MLAIIPALADSDSETVTVTVTLTVTVEQNHANQNKGWNKRANKITGDRTRADDVDDKPRSRSSWFEKGSMIEVDHVA